MTRCGDLMICDGTKGAPASAIPPSSSIQVNSHCRNPFRRAGTHGPFVLVLALLAGWAGLTAVCAGPLDQWSAPATPPTTHPLYAVAAGPGRVVAVGKLGVVASSADLSAWTVTQNGPDLSAVAYGNRGFFAAGETGSGLASADGVNWYL